MRRRGRGRERPGERDALLLAARQLGDPAGARSPASPTSASVARARASASARGRRCMRSPKLTFPTTSRCGKSAWSWNMRPNPRRCGGTPARSTPFHRTCPVASGVEPGDGAEQRALAAPARPEHAHDLAVRPRRGRRRRARRPIRNEPRAVRPRASELADRSDAEALDGEDREPRSRPSGSRSPPSPRRSSAGPGWPSRRKMSDRHRRASRPDDEDRGAELAERDGEGEAGRHERGAGRRSAGRPRATPAPATRRASPPPRAGADRWTRSTGRHDADDERDRDQRLRDRDEHPRRAEVERRLVERDEEPEADRHRRHAERQRAAAASSGAPAPSRSAPPRTRSPPTTTAMHGRDRRRSATSCRSASSGEHEERAAAMELVERAVEVEAVPASACAAIARRGRRSDRRAATAITARLAPTDDALARRPRPARRSRPRRAGAASRAPAALEPRGERRAARDDRGQLHDASARPPAGGSSSCAVWR